MPHTEPSAGSPARPRRAPPAAPVRVPARPAPILTMPLAMTLALAGCTTWDRPGATPQQRDAALARCESVAYHRHPPEIILVLVPGGYEPARRECRRDRDGNERCTSTDGYRRPDRYDRRDVATDARRATVAACMTADGWVERSAL